ncbi:hypothetical protein SAMN04488574_101227 [Bacillus sp. 71mf]|nr:hypothetical protein SAMN04488574_101227 [Bacillus sp. 71mf]SFS92631.1 hypothetical protein SAMN04488145_10563 [Bacillus sp. 103mf]
MGMTLTLMVILGCFLFAELFQLFIRNILSKRRTPYELQYFPLFLMLFFMLYILQKVTLFPPTIEIFLKLGLLYSCIGMGILCCLFFLRYVHYQTYILILNWLNRDDGNRLS